ncbi:uncharacterized protein LOC124370865 [Homalodisca vitripennis]|uniref:uncharacterized protein LOC124370865 n=1 Tax=Homalodisca vitripennis TaxID=197043 RepID=UPI001EEC580B|nr:uncharacterized protein LOC124370865 [Homalodisca vitripennis]
MLTWTKVTWKSANLIRNFGTRIGSEGRGVSGLAGSVDVPGAGPGRVPARSRRRDSLLGSAPWPHADLPCCEALAVWSRAGPYRVSPLRGRRCGRRGRASCLRGRRSTINSELARTRGIRLSN